MTLHKTFRLQMYYHGSNPESIAITDAGRNLEKIQYFIFDEMSLIGLNILGFLSERLKSIHRVNAPFGNQSYILLGDISQLRPIGQKVLFASNEDGHLEGLDLKGYEVYRSIVHSVVLTEMMRQSAEGENEFRNLLLEIRRGVLTDDGFEKLNSRYIRNLPPEECQLFAQPETVFLFADRAAVHQYNMFRVDQLESPKLDIYPIASRRAPPGHIPVPLRLAVGARVFLTFNLCVEHGLYNGSTGTVTRFGETRKDGKTIECVFVKFDFYYGPRFQLGDDIPIVRREIPTYSEISNCSWTSLQFPLCLSFASTIHKAQGATLKRVVIGLPDPNTRDSMLHRMAPAIMYVACSRVKSLKDIAFSKPFQRELVAKKYTGTHLTDWMAEEQRLIQMEI